MGIGVQVGFSKIWCIYHSLEDIDGYNVSGLDRNWNENGHLKSKNWNEKVVVYVCISKII